MKQARHYTALAVGLLLTTTCAGAAFSADPPTTAAAPTPAEPAADSGGLPVEIDLDAVSGRGVTATALSTQDLTAVNSGNTVRADVVGSGPISLQGNALGGFSGVGNFVMNTGHNNNLQSSLSVTIVVTQ